MCSAKEISVHFNGLTGLARRPIAHTCNLELSISFNNFEEFFGEFQVILSGVNRKFSFRMDAI